MRSLCRPSSSRSSITHSHACASKRHSIAKLLIGLFSVFLVVSIGEFRKSTQAIAVTLCQPLSESLTVIE